eukprot:3813751-Rhodomonas_salina.3
MQSCARRWPELDMYLCLCARGEMTESKETSSESLSTTISRIKMVGKTKVSYQPKWNAMQLQSQHQGIAHQAIEYGNEPVGKGATGNNSNLFCNLPCSVLLFSEESVFITPLFPTCLCAVGL